MAEEDSIKFAYWERQSQNGNALADRLEREAEQGDLGSRTRLGKWYLTGECTGEKNEAKAIVLIESAAQEGYTEAQYELGFMYCHGMGVARDPQQAVKWFEKAAAQGNIDAQLKLGNMFMQGTEIDKDYEKAFYFVKQAAEQGNLDAQFNLGDMYQNGWGVEKDHYEATMWYEKAVKQLKEDLSDTDDEIVVDRFRQSD